MKKMAGTFCYQDKSRLCDESCEAHKRGLVIYGPVSTGAPITGSCLDLGLKARLANGLHEIGERLGSKVS